MTAGLPAGLADAIRAERSAVIDKLGRDPVLWLAVAPLWTRDAAEAAAFPASGLTGFIEQACAAGWCETRGSLLDDEPGGLLFWMPDEVRRDALSILAEQPGPDLVKKAVDIARRVTAVTTRYQRAGTAGALPGALLDWAELLTQRAPEQALVDRVRAAVEADELGRAQQLVSAGETLAPLLSGTAELALDRARRLMSLGARRRNDRRALIHYMDRPELSAAVAALRHADTEQWALHLRGVGGVGKTMLIRDLASGHYATEGKIAPFPVARADFDHISADYPVRKPVQLLVVLSDELALHAAGVTQADQALYSFRAAATSAHEMLSSSREDDGPVLDNPLVLRAVDAFAQVLESLSGVLLVLDTCEELAKADAGNPDAPAVTATFDIIERLQAHAPSMRLLLAGRRPLPDRHYLAVTDVDGFTVDEATTYLTEFSSRPLSSELVTAMIRQSAAVDAEIPKPGTMPGRVSPFDLALYLSWAEEDPHLSKERVLAGSDAYVEGRILERLRDPLVRSALPALAMIGRSRVETLASFTTGVTQAATTLGTRLAEQEWIDASGDPPRYVTPKPVLGQRLRRYFGAPGRAAQYRAVTTRLAEWLTWRIEEAPLAEIEVDELLAALRLAAPVDAARLWDSIADRATEPPGHWGWMLNVTRRVIGESDDEQWPTADATRATVLASHIAARRRASPTYSPDKDWADVRASADRHPDRIAASTLRARAALGLLPYAPADESLWQDMEAAPSSAVLAAAAADAADRLLETGQSKKATYLFRESSHLNSALEGLAGPRVQAWALAARDRLAAEDAPVRVKALAENLAAKTGPHPAWPDWVPPEDLLARVRIERGLLDPPEGTVLGEWEAYARRDLRSIDRERLASLCLRVRLDRGTIEPSVLERWEELDSYLPSRRPTCSAHDLVPPLCATLAEAELAAGRPDRALALVSKRRDEALATRKDSGDDATLRAMDEETVRIVRRFRLDGQRPVLARLAATEPRADAGRLRLRDSARRALAVVYHEAEDPSSLGPEVLRRPEGWHAWWQTLQTLPADPPSIRWPASGPGTGLAADIELDIEEARQLGGAQLAERFEDWFADWLARPRRAITPVRSPDPYHDVRVSLRRQVLAGADFTPDPQFPGRRLAELAFEEAELLAPRLPAAAARLFGLARDAFAQAGDQIGQLLATASRASLTGEQLDLQQAFRSLRTENQAAADALSGPPADAGPWAFWAAAVQGLGVAEGEPRPDHPEPGTGRVPGVIGRRRLTSYLSVSSYSVLAALLYSLFQTRVISLLAAVLVFFGTIAVGGLVALISLTAPGFRRVVDGRGVGAFPFSLANLSFRANVGRDDEQGSDRVLLTTDLRVAPVPPAFDLPIGAWFLVFVLLSPIWAFWIYLVPPLRVMQDRLRRRRPPTGYTGRLAVTAAEPARVDWIGDPPTARDRWWQSPSGTTRGNISMGRAEVNRPWERILAASLGPAAAGRIRWTRILTTTVEPFPSSITRWVAVEAPSAWTRSLTGRYGAGAPGSDEADESRVRIRHAIGRAVVTSAGPRLDISGDVTDMTGARELLGTEMLTRGQPSVIVLQAEPVTEAIGIELIDDLPEKLELAADLIEAGTPAVLIVPAVPAEQVDAIAKAIAKHAKRRRGYDGLQLRSKLWWSLSGSSDRSMRDDLLLLRNPRSHS